MAGGTFSYFFFQEVKDVDADVLELESTSHQSASLPVWSFTFIAFLGVPSGSNMGLLRKVREQDECWDKEH